MQTRDRWVLGTKAEAFVLALRFRSRICTNVCCLMAKNGGQDGGILSGGHPKDGLLCYHWGFSFRVQLKTDVSTAPPWTLLCGLWPGRVPTVFSKGVSGRAAAMIELTSAQPGLSVSYEWPSTILQCSKV
ncbi:hypothetical protein J6590_093598 [Homalodisca vitripennis]|nr:hypothetical protein J6590_093598 [Homalodisca vitripennis]